ncbi:amidohydrolase family protein [Candidatus Latescibacterota bacterium]
MKTLLYENKTVAARVVLLMVLLIGCSEHSDRQAGSDQVNDKGESPLTRIDSHAHIYPDLLDATLEKTFVDMLDSQNIKWLNICTRIDSGVNLKKRIAIAQELHSRYPDRIFWATSFDISDFGTVEWEKNALDCISDGINHGAVAVKVWKEIGMVLRDDDGSYVMIDDPRFEPLWTLLESRDVTLVAHLGEPRNCWLPVDSMTVDGDRNYFKNNPQYHAYLHPEIPHYWKQIEARDDLLTRHPNLRVVGCHLGSLEFDTDELAKRLDKYSNFAVDTAARISHFKVQDAEKVRNFLIKYQDRILYGTDIGIRNSGSFANDFERIRNIYTEDYRYFSTDGDFESPASGEKVRGLALPPEVLEKIFHTNYMKWYPGIE